MSYYPGQIFRDNFVGDWKTRWKLNQANGAPVNESGELYTEYLRPDEMRITFPQNQSGSTANSGRQFYSNCFVDDYPSGLEAAVISCKITLENGFVNSVPLGTKMGIGLGGGNCNTGGETSDGITGWSIRLVKTDTDRWGTYRYSADQSDVHGQQWGRGNDSAIPLVDVREVFIELAVKMNTPNLYDGIIELWVDRVKVASEYNVRIRNTAALTIDTLMFSTFPGGSGQAYAPTATAYYKVRDICLREFGTQGTPGVELKDSLVFKEGI